MAIQTRTLIPQTKSDDPNNGWEQLRLQLDPIVINAPRIQEAGARLPRRLGNWLARSVSRFPWLNQLALAAVIYNESGAVQPIDPILGIHSFLRWAIPARYPDVSSLKLDEALVAYFGDPPQRRGQRACNGFNAVQLHMHAYLQSLPAETRTALAPFLLPILMDTPRLARLRAYSLHESQNRRKEQAFAVVRDLHALSRLVGDDTNGSPIWKLRCNTSWSWPRTTRSPCPRSSGVQTWIIVKTSPSGSGIGSRGSRTIFKITMAPPSKKQVIGIGSFSNSWGLCPTRPGSCGRLNLGR